MPAGLELTSELVRVYLRVADFLVTGARFDVWLRHCKDGFLRFEVDMHGLPRDGLRGLRLARPAILTFLHLKFKFEFISSFISLKL